MDELERIKQLAGIDKNASVDENLSLTSTKKAQYQRKHNVQPGTDEWFNLWFARPKLTGENPMPKK